MVVELDDFRSAGVVVAGHFFKNIFGQVIGENVLPIAVVVSAFGNIAATSFAQARVNQELGRDGLLPFSRFFAGNAVEGGDAPVSGLFLHWLVSVLVIVVPPPGEIYDFLVDIGGYPVSIISVAISGGLLYLQLTPSENYDSPFKAKKIYTVVFMLSNVLLLILPWIKPAEEKGDGRFPYYAYPATALAILGSGVIYWGYWRISRLVVGREFKMFLFGNRESKEGERREMKEKEETRLLKKDMNKSNGVMDSGSGTGSRCACSCACSQKRNMMKSKDKGDNVD